MVEIKITGNTPLEALATLTAFGLHCLEGPDVCAAAKRILETEKAKDAKETATAAPMTQEESRAMVAAAKEFDPGVATMAATPTNPQASADLPPEPYVEEPPHSTPAPEPKPPTLVETRAKGLEAARKYGQPAVKAILDGFGVPSMTALAECDRAAFLVKLEGLGDGNAR